MDYLWFFDIVFFGAWEPRSSSTFIIFIMLNFFFGDPQKKVSNMGLEQHEGE